MNRRRNYRQRSGKPRWLISGLNSRWRKRWRVFALSLFSVLLSTAVLSSFAIFRFLRTPFAEAQGSVDRESPWSGRTHLNLALLVLDDLDNEKARIERLGVISIEPGDARLGLLHVSVGTSVSVPLGFGEHPLREVYALGSAAEPASNIELVLRSVAGALGLPIDAYLLTDVYGERLLGNLTSLDELLASRWDTSLRLLGNISSLRKHVRTNLSLTELTKLVDYFLGVRLERVAESIWEPTASLGNMFADSGIEKEGLRVMVLNGTGTVGLASRAARIMRNLGVNVTEVGNDENSHRRESVIYAEDPDSYTVGRLGRVLGISSVQLPPSNLYRRAGCVVVLGEDFAGD